MALVQKTLIKLAYVASTGPLRPTIISFHCFKLDAVASETRREGEDSLWPEKFPLFPSPKQSATLLTLRSFVLMSPWEVLALFLWVCFIDAGICKGRTIVSSYLFFQDLLQTEF